MEHHQHTRRSGSGIVTEMHTNQRIKKLVSSFDTNVRNMHAHPDGTIVIDYGNKGMRVSIHYYKGMPTCGFRFDHRGQGRKAGRVVSFSNGSVLR